MQSKNKNYNDTKVVTNQRSQSKVLYIRKLACSITTYLLQHVISQYGPVVRTVILRPKNEALVEMQSIEDAIKVYEIGQHQGIVIHKSAIKITYSDHQNIEDLLNHNPVNNILLFTICTIPGSYLHIEDLVKNIEKYGQLRRIRLFKNYSIHHALVQMNTIEDATNVKDKMSKISIQVRNDVFRFDIQYSKLTELTIYQNNSTCLNYDLITPNPYMDERPSYTSASTLYNYPPSFSYSNKGYESFPSYSSIPSKNLFTDNDTLSTSLDSSPSGLSQNDRASDMISESTEDAMTSNTYSPRLNEHNMYSTSEPYSYDNTYNMYYDDTIIEPSTSPYLEIPSYKYDYTYRMRPVLDTNTYSNNNYIPYSSNIHDPYDSSEYIMKPVNPMNTMNTMNTMSYTSYTNKYNQQFDSYIQPHNSYLYENSSIHIYTIMGLQKSDTIDTIEFYFNTCRLFTRFNIYMNNNSYMIAGEPKFNIYYMNEYLQQHPFNNSVLTLSN